ncbi:hypothetical protein Hanom_Chr03g00256701 [Helianthus anomalus]
MFSTNPRGYFIERSANRMLILVGDGSPRSSFVKTLYGIRLILPPKSANAWLTDMFPIKHGSVKLPGSPIFVGRRFCRTAEQVSFITTHDISSSFCLFERISFRNFAYFGIWAKASTNGILMCSCLNNSRNLPYCSSFFCFFSLPG